MKHTKIIKKMIFANLIIIGSYQLFAPFYAVYATQIGASIAQVGLIWSAQSLITAISLLIFGKIENNLDKRKIVVYGFFMYSIGAFALLLANNLYTLTIILMLNSLITGFTAPSFKALFASLEDKGKETEEWSWHDAGNMLSISIGSALGGLAITLFGFKGVFLCIGTLQLLAALLIKNTLKPTIDITADVKKLRSIAEKYN